MGCACRECVYITLIWAFFTSHTAGPIESQKHAVMIIFVEIYFFKNVFRALKSLTCASVVLSIITTIIQNGQLVTFLSINTHELWTV